MKLQNLCKCQTCGKEFIHDRTKVRRFCSLKCRPKSRIKEDLVGRKFGRLTVTAEEPLKIKPCGSVKRVFACICDCGKSVSKEYDLLIGKNRKTPSCGCFMKDFGRTRFKHRQTGKRIYYIWSNMKERCFNPNNKKFHLYGGKGVKVCERWMVFENFYEDVKDGYAENLTIDRYPNKHGDYEPTNFRWATKQEQNWNLSTNIVVSILGYECVASELCDLLGYKNGKIQNRLKAGWPNEEAVLGKSWSTTDSSYLKLIKHINEGNARECSNIC